VRDAAAGEADGAHPAAAVHRRGPGAPNAAGPAAGSIATPRPLLRVARREAVPPAPSAPPAPGPAAGRGALLAGAADGAVGWDAEGLATVTLDAPTGPTLARSPWDDLTGALGAAGGIADRATTAVGGVADRAQQAVGDASGVLGGVAQDLAATARRTVGAAQQLPGAALAAAGGAAADMEEMYEQFVERLRRDLLAEVERAGGGLEGLVP
jgi:hypothetical protein